MANEFPKFSEAFALGKTTTYKEAVEQAWFPQDSAMVSVPSVSPIETLVLDNNTITPTVALGQIIYYESVSDNILNFIDYSNLRDGAVIQLRIQDNTYPLVIKNGIVGDGSILTADGNDITLTDYRKIVQFQREGTLWRQVGGIQMQADLQQTDETRPDFVKGKELLVTKVNNVTPIEGNVNTYPNQNNITNCITEIPQDIKLELNDGTLTLKAGSKVYVPNGVGNFDEVIVASDLTLARNSSAMYFSFLKGNGAASDTMPVNYCYSGASAPTVTHTYAMWYDTANNKIKWTGDNGSTWVEGYSFPLCIIVNDTPGTQNVSSLDQVFNGFGYVGSTIFALPGVKGLIPDGRNADGSLKNIEFAVSSVERLNVASWAALSSSNSGYFMRVKTNIHNYIAFQPFVRFYTKLQTPNNTTITNFAYIEKENQWYFWDANATNWIKAQIILYVSIEINKGITSFNPKLPFRAVDYNEVKSLGTTITYWE